MSSANAGLSQPWALWRATRMASCTLRAWVVSRPSLASNGVLDPGDPALPGVTVFLDANGNSLLDPGEASSLSDINGNYSLPNLLAGTYRVREAQQAELVQTTANPADILLLAGQDVNDVNFGDFQSISISGLKFGLVSQ